MSACGLAVERLKNDIKERKSFWKISNGFEGAINVYRRKKEMKMRSCQRERKCGKVNGEI